MKRLFQFWLTGITGTIVDMFVLWFFSRHVFNSTFLIYYIAPIISFEFAMFNNYNISYFWVWKDRNKVSNVSSYLMKLVKYNITCTVAFGVKMFFLILTKEFFGFDVLVCNMIGLCFSFVVNYFGGDKFVFRKKEGYYGS